MQGAHWSYTPTVKCENSGINHSWHNTGIIVYQKPLILTALLHVDLINVAYLTPCTFIRSSWRYTFIWPRQCHSITTNIDCYVIITSLNSELTCELINRIPGWCLLISSLPGSASRMHVESLVKPCDSTSVLKVLSGKPDIKRHSPSILYISASLAIQQAFPKPCLVNLISKDTHLVLSIYFCLFNSWENMLWHGSDKVNVPPWVLSYFPWSYIDRGWSRKMPVSSNIVTYWCWHTHQGIFCPSTGVEFRPDSQSKMSTFFPIPCLFFPIKKSKKKKKKKKKKFTFFKNHYYLWETMIHIRMIHKHVCLSGMLGIIQSKVHVTWFWGYILLPLLCSISLISPHFDGQSIIFSQFWPGAFSQNCWKKPCLLRPTVKSV